MHTPSQNRTLDMHASPGEYFSLFLLDGLLVCSYSRPSCLNHRASFALLSGWHFILFFFWHILFWFLPAPLDLYLFEFSSGGGVGGLTLAFALSKSPNIRVEVYEAASKFTEIGAGIGIWWRTRQVLKSLGLEEDVVRLLPFRPGQDRSESGQAAGL
jgi:hypothetical protein